MARVHLARHVAAAGVSRVVAVKRLHPHLAADEKVRAMFVDEARLSSRVVDPHVVRTLDVVDDGGAVVIVMDHVVGLSLARLVDEAVAPPPLAVAARLLVDLLAGLEAAHAARDEDGRPLGLVHRDVSPQNVLVGKDGSARVIDFGIAKAARRLAVTEAGETKGKQGYMAPEQLLGEPTTRATDVWAAGVVAWELVTGRALFDGPGSVRARLEGELPDAPSVHRADVPRALDDALSSALAYRPADRPPTARALAEAVANAVAPAAHAEVARWVDDVAGDALAILEEQVARVARARDASATDAPPGRGPEPAPPALASPAPRPGASRWRGAAGVVVGVAVASLVAAGAAVVAARAAPSPPREALVAEPPEPRADPSAPVESPVAAPPPAAAPLAPDVPDASAPARTRTSRPRVAAPSRGPSTAPRAARCSPPWVVDDAGRKIYRPECF